MAEYIIAEDEHRAAMRKAYEAGEEACGHAEVRACAMRDPVEIARLSVSAGTTAEEACANIAAWCSCDPLRRAEAERDEAVFFRYCYEEAKASERRALAERDCYRDKALSAECRYRIACGICGSRCDDDDDDDYCDAVIEEVDA